MNRIQHLYTAAATALMIAVFTLAGTTQAWARPLPPGGPAPAAPTPAAPTVTSSADDMPSWQIALLAAAAVVRIAFTILLVMRLHSRRRPAFHTARAQWSAQPSTRPRTSFEHVEHSTDESLHARH